MWKAPSQQEIVETKQLNPNHPDSIVMILALFTYTISFLATEGLNKKLKSVSDRINTWVIFDQIISIIIIYHQEIQTSSWLVVGCIVKVTSS